MAQVAVKLVKLNWAFIVFHPMLAVDLVVVPR